MSLASDIILDYMVREKTVIESKRSAALDTADAIRDGLFPRQRGVLEDPSTRKAALCPRRAGKTWTAISAAFDTCLRQDYAHVVICMLTLKQAKQIYWKHMERFARHFGLDLAWHLHDMTIRFKNGSQITLVGCESVQHIEKLRGDSYDLAIVDECKSFNPSILSELLNDVLDPALADRDGTMLLIGTPGDILSGPFYWATAPYYEITDEDGNKRPFSRTFVNPEPFWNDRPEDDYYWSKHTWTKKDNTYLPKLWQQALRTKKLNKWADDNPTWRRESLGEWVPSTGSYVYKYAEMASGTNETMVNWYPDKSRAATWGLPDGHDWRFICGLDLGYEDDYAIVVAAYSNTDGSLYHVYDWKENHKDVFHIAEQVARVLKMFGSFDAMVADAGALGELVVETLNSRWGFYFEKADKKEKFDHIELMNAEFMAGRVKVIPKSGLDFELRNLQYLLEENDDKALLARTNKLKVNPAQPNHLSDAFLYLWRYTFHHWSTPRVDAPEHGSFEYVQQQALDTMTRIAQARHEQQLAQGWLEKALYVHDLN